MTSSRLALSCLTYGALLLVAAGASAQSVRVLETTPAVNGTIEGASSAFSIRFDKPVDHVQSTLVIKRGEAVVETLKPRLQSAPDVLFARASTLPPGDYKLHWLVRTPTNSEPVDIEIPFSISK